MYCFHVVLSREWISQYTIFHSINFYGIGTSQCQLPIAPPAVSTIEEALGGPEESGPDALPHGAARCPMSERVDQFNSSDGPGRGRHGEAFPLHFAATRNCE